VTLLSPPFNPRLKDPVPSFIVRFGPAPLDSPLLLLNSTDLFNYGKWRVNFRTHRFSGPLLFLIFRLLGTLGRYSVSFDFAAFGRCGGWFCLETVQSFFFPSFQSLLFDLGFFARIDLPSNRLLSFGVSFPPSRPFRIAPCFFFLFFFFFFFFFLLFLIEAGVDPNVAFLVRLLLVDGCALRILNTYPSKSHYDFSVPEVTPFSLSFQLGRLGL